MFKSAIDVHDQRPCERFIRNFATNYDDKVAAVKKCGTGRPARIAVLRRPVDEFGV